MSRIALNAFLLVVPSYGEFPGSIRSQLSGKCWDLPGGDYGNGNIIWQWTCSGTDNQRWNFHEDDGTLRLSASPNKCLDVWGGDYSNGNQMQIWDCLGVPQQAVGYDANMGTIYFPNSASDAAKCADLAGGGSDDGTPMIVWDCIGNKNQQWLYTPESDDPVVTTPSPAPSPTGITHIKSVLDSQCVEVKDSKHDNGAELWLWDCGKHKSRQQWMFSDGAIMLGDNSKCADAPDRGNGAHIQIWDCNGLPQQMWGYDSQFQRVYLTHNQDGTPTPDSGHSKCLQRFDSSGYPGTFVEIWNCLPYPNQKWEFVDAGNDDVVV